MTGWEPATEAEAAMRDALRGGDQELYFRILARTELLLPVSSEALAGRAPMGWGTWTTGGRTHVLAFTSSEALRACLAEHAGSARRMAYHELAAGWPNLEWWLAVNPGLPIEGYLPAWFVAQLARGDVRLPGRTMASRARLDQADTISRTRATAAVPRTAERSAGLAAGAPGAPAPTDSADGRNGAYAGGLGRAPMPSPAASVGSPLPTRTPGQQWAPAPVDEPTDPGATTRPDEQDWRTQPLPRRTAPNAWPASPSQAPADQASAADQTAADPSLDGTVDLSGPAAEQTAALFPPSPAAARPGPAAAEPDPMDPAGDPEQPGADADPDFTPANDVERELLAAASRSSTDTFLSTLLLARVLLPVPDDAPDGPLPGDEKFTWRTETIDDEPYVVVFTSTERMADYRDERMPTASVKFIQLIHSWPNESWSFAVNPGTPIGATLPGAQILALANWADEVGLGGDAGDEPADAQAPDRQPESAPVRPATQAEAIRPTVMQKAIAPAQVGYYLERGYDRVSGFVHRVSEVAHLTTPGKLFAALGLGYPGSPFASDAAEVHVLRWPAYCPNLYRIPYGGQSEAAMRAMDGWVIERAPFRGNGFAPGDSSDVVAEFKVDSVRLPHGTQLWRLAADGSQTLVAVLDTDEPSWRRADEESAESTPGSETASARSADPAGYAAAEAGEPAAVQQGPGDQSGDQS